MRAVAKEQYDRHDYFDFYHYYHHYLYLLRLLSSCYIGTTVLGLVETVHQGRGIASGWLTLLYEGVYFDYC